MTDSEFKIVIPARYNSSRFPGKPVALIAGVPMVIRVYQQACKSDATQVIVATDDKRVADVCNASDVPVCMTSPDHPTGTDRIAEVAKTQRWSADDIIVNVQGDEPLIPVSTIQQVASNLHQNNQASIATLATPITDYEEFTDPNNVKVVFDHAGMAHYFSRAPIPFDRDGDADPLSFTGAFRHLGLYAYRAGFLFRYSEMQECHYESMEKLEQLRALWHGERIHVDIAAELPGMGVDTPEQLAQVESLIEESKRS